jgi:hypothetical protein
MSAIPVLYSFARSGGTLANQLLGVHPQCLVLSEVNPAGSYKPVADQAIEWLELAGPDERDQIHGLPYGRQIRLLRERAAQRNRTLVVRDWNTPNFLPGIAPHVAASGALEQAMYLERAGLEPLPLVVTRRAAAVYRSIVDNFAQLRELTLDSFAAAYIAYARAVATLPRLHLESLRAQPQGGAERLLQAFGLDPSPAANVLRDFHGFRKCTGNNTLEGRGGSADARCVIAPEPPPALEHPLLGEADALLGYER